MEIIANTKKVNWAFNTNEKWNPAVWATILVPKTGTSASDALSDFFTNSNKYSTACLDATLVVMLHSIASVLPEQDLKEFNKAYNVTAEMKVKDRINGLIDTFLLQMNTEDYKDWVPGDWGWLVNGLFFEAEFDQGKFAKLGGKAGEEGENIIFVGGDQYWGFPGGNKTFRQWCDTVESWNKKAERLAPYRYVPPVGLVLPAK